MEKIAENKEVFQMDHWYVVLELNHTFSQMMMCYKQEHGHLYGQVTGCILIAVTVNYKTTKWQGLWTGSHDTMEANIGVCVHLFTRAEKLLTTAVIHRNSVSTIFTAQVLWKVVFSLFLKSQKVLLSYLFTPVAHSVLYMKPFRGSNQWMFLIFSFVLQISSCSR